MQFCAVVPVRQFCGVAEGPWEHATVAAEPVLHWLVAWLPVVH